MPARLQSLGQDMRVTFAKDLVSIHHCSLYIHAFAGCAAEESAAHAAQGGMARAARGGASSLFFHFSIDWLGKTAGGEILFRGATEGPALY